jgi:hypothetical protein
MPDKPKTPQRAIRVPDERWEALGRASAAVGTNRSEIINTLIARYLREPGTKPPRRPDHPDNGEG